MKSTLNEADQSGRHLCPFKSQIFPRIGIKAVDTIEGWIGELSLGERKVARKVTLLTVQLSKNLQYFLPSNIERNPDWLQCTFDRNEISRLGTIEGFLFLLLSRNP